MVIAAVGVLLSLVLWWQRRSPGLMVWLSGVLCSFALGGCGGVPDPPDVPVPQDRLRELCWQPPETPTSDYFYFPDSSAEASSVENRFQVEKALADHGFLFTYNAEAPALNLRLLPMSRSDAWCTTIPKPTDANVLQLLSPCIAPAFGQQERVVARNLMGQTEPSVRSTLFCGQVPQMAPTPQASISLLARNIAYQSAYEQARKIGQALTQAEADMKSVLNKDRGWFKRALTSDPGSLEQIQQRVADQLNLIESPIEYDDPILEMLSFAGYKAGFEEGKFDVQAKLFAIDASIFIVEFVALEIALGPLGGAKLIVSAASKGAKVVTTVATKGSELVAYTSTKGAQALAAAMKRLENIPIFIPGAAGGVGAFVKAGIAIKRMSQTNAALLEAAMFAEARILGKTLTKLATDHTHHIVAQAAEKAKGAREILAKFGIDINHAANGVFLPGTKLAPNPNGAIVHAILANNKKYYLKVEEALMNAHSQAEALEILRRIGETLVDGTFFHARF